MDFGWVRSFAPLGLAVFLVLGVTSAGQAQRGADARARAAFERGARAFDAGSYQEALDAFNSAFELSERPELLYNIGLAQDRLRMDSQALSSFQRYLAAVPDSPYRAQVESRISALSQAEARREAERQALDEGSKKKSTGF